MATHVADLARNGLLAGTNFNSTDQEFRLGDSPWFWLALFGTVAMLGLIAVNQKYSKRQMRIELRYQNRLRTQELRAERMNSENSTDGSAEPGEPPVELPISAQAAQPRAGLAPLLALFATSAGAGYLGLYVSYRRHRFQFRGK